MMTAAVKTTKERSDSYRPIESLNSNGQPTYSSGPTDNVLQLQQAVGNKTLQGLFETGFIQGKLTIGQPNDIYEQEADRVAAEVMRMPDSDMKPQSVPDEQEGVLQSVSVEHTHLMSRIDSRDKQDTERTTEEIVPNLEYQINSIKGSGRALSKSLRAFFEPRFGQNFSNVLIHNNSKAAAIAQSLNAKAFTTGRNIVFGAGQYAPETSEGKRLMAHELTHFVQQNGYQVLGNLTISQPGDRYEQGGFKVPKSQGNIHAQRILTPGSLATSGIVQREVVRNDVVDYTYIPDGRLPFGIVVDLNFPHEASQGQISRDLIVALRRWVMTREQDRSPGLVNAIAFQMQLGRYLRGYRLRQRPSIRGEWEYRIYIQLNRNIESETGFRVESIAIDTRRHPSIPQPDRPEGPSEAEREDWIDRAIADPGVRSSVRSMLEVYKRGQLDGKYFTSGQVDQYVRVAGLTYSELNNLGSDACTRIVSLREHSRDYWRFKAGVLQIRTVVLGGLNRIDFHDGEGQPIETSPGTARTMHCWMWQRQGGQNNVYSILAPTPCRYYARRRRTC